MTSSRLFKLGDKVRTDFSGDTVGRITGVSTYQIQITWPEGGSMWIDLIEADRIVKVQP